MQSAGKVGSRPPVADCEPSPQGNQNNLPTVTVWGNCRSHGTISNLLYDWLLMLRSNSDRPYWYSVFAWIFTCIWICALVWAWLNYGRWPLGVKILVGIGLILTTPAGGDLFILARHGRPDPKVENKFDKS
jgi:hypothetical protein